MNAHDPLTIVDSKVALALKMGLAFFKMLDPDRAKGDFRTFGEGQKRGEKRLTRTFKGSLVEHAYVLQRLNAEGAGVFVTINRTDGKGIGKENITEIVAVFADTDGAPLEPLLALKPHICIESSPGNYHVYWLVKDCSLEQFAPIQRAIASKFGTDLAVNDVGRVMRLPGFCHNKHDTFMVTFAPKHMDPSQALYSVADLVERLGLTLDAVARTATKPVEGLAANVASKDYFPPSSAMKIFERCATLAHIAAGKGVGEPAWRDAMGVLKYTVEGEALCHEISCRDPRYNQEETQDKIDRWTTGPALCATFREFPEMKCAGCVQTCKSPINLGRDPLRSAGANSTTGGYMSFGPFTMDAGDGLTKEVTITRGKNVNIETHWISAPFEVLGHCRDPHGRGWGKQLRFKDSDGRVHMRHAADADLHGEPTALCADLAGNGLKINRERHREFADYLVSVSVGARVTVVGRTGWHEIGGRMVFVLPEETIGGGAGEAVALDAAAHGPYSSAGSLDDWKRGVGNLTSGHVLPVVGVSAALAGPLMQLVEAEGGGVHLVGSSSCGKSTILAAGASVWGRGEARGGFIRSWRSTANGLEGLAASATDCVLVLDELGVGEV
ncbi:DUF927 domain-containing protein [uncultured Rhodoblastus sp.]|uniref:DUF927 domain-containing protein n=1 Tax=uncultured Rhodoblastus sp. TaxID=543037 RepID=UPI0025DE5CD6|nr:DUF927 domain-containing protein [uncultured Rhodoblastus sp.]